MLKRALIAVAALALVAAPPAAAADLTRPEYKAQVEPICKRNATANERILKNVRKMVRQGKLRPAGAKFLRAGAALKKTYNQLRAVPQPTADEGRLAKWLRYVKKEADLFTKAGRALKAKNRSKAQRFVNQLTSNANKANATVLPFNFRDCKFNPSKFT